MKHAQYRYLEGFPNVYTVIAPMCDITERKKFLKMLALDIKTCVSNLTV